MPQDEGPRPDSRACAPSGTRSSPTKAKKTIRGESLLQRLEGQGIIIRAGSMAGLAEEAPAAYKDVDAVVKTVIQVGIASPVARLRPLVVIKG